VPSFRIASAFVAAPSNRDALAAPASRLDVVNQRLDLYLVASGEVARGVELSNPKSM
jgi:hypothetical protein